MRLLLAAFTAVALCSCAPVTPPPSDPAKPTQTPEASACTARGGRLQQVGRMQTWQCILRYSDAGKRCTDGDQCQGDCRLPDDAALPEGRAAAGICHADSNRFGCHTTVENGRAEATLCVD